MPRVLIGPSILFDVENEYRSVLRKLGFDFVHPDRPKLLSEDELIKLIADCDASLAGSEPYTRRVLDAAPKLRFISRVGVGYDAVDLAACTKKGIVVTFATGNADGVAEHAIGLMIALARDFPGQYRAMQEGRWPRRSLVPLRGKTLAIAGLGRCGKAVAVRAKALDMRIIACDIVHDDAFAQKYGIEWRDFDDLFIEGDFISLHLPLTEQTRQCVNKDQLEHMKKTAYLINTSRGGIVNEQDLYDFLHDERCAGAGLDVFEKEPPTNSPLLHLPNVVLTAHTAGIDTRSRDELAMRAAQNLAALWQGQWPAEFVVNPEVKDKMKR